MDPEWKRNGKKKKKKRKGAGSATEQKQRRSWPKRTATQEATACVDKGYMQKWIITRA